MRINPTQLLLSGLALFLAGASASASPEYLRQVPNAAVHRCSTCHEPAGPPDLNKFGDAFFNANCKWTATLAAQDSDGDGISNGQELGDPDGTWKPGTGLTLASMSISLPGDASSRPVPVSPLVALLAPFTTLMGHFHPVFVHLPIGGLLLVGLLEILACVPRLQGVAQNRRLLLGLTLAGALTAVICGCVLSQSGSYQADLLLWHRWTGIGVALASLATWLWSLSPYRPAYQFSLWGTILLLCFASHYGGSLTHGRDYLALQLPARQAPEPQVTTSKTPGPSARLQAGFQPVP